MNKKINFLKQKNNSLKMTYKKIILSKNIFLIILYIIKLTCQEPTISGQNFHRKTDFSFIPAQISLSDYFILGNCQSITNKCSIVPNYPRSRAFHSSVIYSTYSQEEANEMCPDNFCGPFCNYTDDSCESKYTYQGYPLPDITLGNYNFKGPNDTNCPNQCCDDSCEFCYRYINNAGVETFPNEEIMLVFGGLTNTNVTININGSNKDIVKECEDIIDNYKNIDKSSMTSDQQISLLYLVNNCGYEMTNELWSYNINRNKWDYVKPYIDSVEGTQQKPYPRYGHTAVIFEKIETSVYNRAFTRKYMLIYGGYSLYCQHSCSDMWIYEISYGPQRYYPNSYYSENPGTVTWETGNQWRRIYPSSDISPGPRVHHSMAIDSSNNYIYLFGGMTVDITTLKNVLINDLWRYSITGNVWEQLNPVGIYQITRPITYWDGTKVTINIEPEEYEKETDKVTTVLQINKESTMNGKFPTERAGCSLVYITLNGEGYLILYAGYSWEVNSIYNIQKQLDDMWVYSIKGNSWMEEFPNGNVNPEKRFFHCMISVGESKLLLYGGMNSDHVLNDVWLFNTNSNIWTQIIKENDESNIENWPFPAKAATLSKFSTGIIIYGGEIWKNSKEDILSYLNYSFIDNIKDEKTYFTIIDNLFILYSNICENNCSSNGECSYNRCICKSNYWGNSCENLYCPGTFCYTDPDIFTKQVCYHCSNNGNCLSNGKCECNEGFIGEDCSIQNCNNDCSGEPYGTCIVMKPQSQCYCNESLRRGGDDCSVVFCLNSCGVLGSCNENDGSCTCNGGYFGDDCSIYILDFRENGFFLKGNFFWAIILSFSFSIF